MIQRLSSAILVAGLLAGCKTNKPASKLLSSEDRATLDKALVAADARAAEFEKQRMAALQTAHESRLRSSGPCPVKVPLPPAMRDASKPPKFDDSPASEAQRWRMGMMLSSALQQAEPPKALKAMQAIEWKVGRMGPRARQFERQRQMLGKIAKTGELGSFDKAAAEALAKKLGSDDYWGWELNVVADVWNEPTHDASGKFKSGVVLGRAYLYQFLEGRVVCVGDVVAQNRKEITIQIDPDDKSDRGHQMLNDDLKNAVFRGAVQQLRAVSTTPPAAAPSKPASAKPAPTSASSVQLTTQ